MNHCAHCGAELGVGRFCVNCGAPVAAAPAPELVDTHTWDALDETVVRPAVPGPLAPIPPVLPPAVAVPSSGPRRKGPRRRTPAVVWVILVLLLLLVLVLGSCLALGVGGDGDGSDAEPDSTPTLVSPTDSETPGATVDPTATGLPSVNLATIATVEQAPRPMSPGTAYGTGETVTYEAAHMLDKDPSTVYRLAGDATGTTLVFDLGRERTITSVGLVNGYAKTSRDGSRTVDHYLANRRVMLVEWTFDDGTVIEQELTETPEPQSLQGPEGLVSRTVTLRLVEVSAPGTGRYAKNSTALGSVLLVGH